MSFESQPTPHRRATLIGLAAIALWGLLAVMTAATAGIPPFQLTAMTFAVGGAVRLAFVAARGQLALLRQPPKAWALGLYGLFGYHAVYFAALKLAPPAEASVVAYLWPLLIVLFSALLPGERLQARHLFGAALGFAGVGALAVSRGVTGFSGDALPGYLLALASAVIWGSYSVLSRLQRDVPTEAVAGYCIGAAALAALCHAAFETTIIPANAWMWAMVILLGLGPVGAAFFFWDHGVKRGDIRFLGVASYATPLISTATLILAGFAEASWGLAIACGLIVGGAFIARQ
ncbi:MAG TPA: EamA family transporter [Beijerinckiaceae bacterium]|nr:EamA family transporter [Beijerinckiaceae bacterium]